MNERIVPIAKAVCGAYDFSKVKKVVDVGGAGADAGDDIAGKFRTCRE